MGDSSVSCVLTGVTLTYEPAVLIALAPASFCEPNRKYPSLDHGARVISNEGASAVFTPVLLPIFGRMDSYGHLTDIEKNEHTAYLEERLGATIEEIADAIIDGQRLPAMAKFAKMSARPEAHPYKKQLTWDGRLYGCIVAREAWDAFSSNFIDEWGKPSYSVWDASWLDPRVLRGLGFVRGREGRGAGGQAGNRYHTPYTHPKLPDVVVWCDQDMSARVTVGDIDLSKKSSIFYPSQFQAALRQYKRALPPEAVAWAKATPSVRLELDKARAHRNRALKQRRKDRARREKFPELTFHLFADTTPEAIRESNNKISDERFQRRMQEWFGTDPDTTEAPKAQLELPRAPEAKLTVPEGAVQSFCDGRKHISLTATADNTASNPVVCDCDGGEACKQDWSGSHRLHSVRLGFTQEALAALVASGWTVQWRSEWMDVSGGPIMRTVAPEMPKVYRGKLLREFADSLAALITFSQSMTAANRLFQPTATGYQYGHLHMQRKVAQLAEKMLTKRINARRE